LSFSPFLVAFHVSRSCHRLLLSFTVLLDPRYVDKMEANAISELVQNSLEDTQKRLKSSEFRNVTTSALIHEAVEDYNQAGTQASQSGTQASSLASAPRLRREKVESDDEVVDDDEPPPPKRGAKAPAAKEPSRASKRPRKPAAVAAAEDEDEDEDDNVEDDEDFGDELEQAFDDDEV